MLKIIRRLGLAVCLLAALSRARADLTLVYEMHLVTTKPTGMQVVKGGAIDAESTAEVTVQLAPDWFSIDGADDVWQVDFKQRRFVYLNKHAKTCTDSPLLARIGFTSAEFKNRLMQAEMFEKMGLKENPMDPVLMEHLFSLRAPNSVLLKGKTEGKTRSWAHRDKPLLSYSTDGFKVSPAEAALFVRCLRYRFGVHPDILNAVAKEGRIPDRMEIHRYNMGTEDYTLKLVKAERASAGLLRVDLKKGATDATEAGPTAICQQAEAMDLAAYRARCEQLMRDALAQRDAGDSLDAVLLLMEYGLSANDLVSAANDTSWLKEAVQHSADCQHLLASVNPRTKETAETAVEELKTLESRAQGGRRMATVFRANILTNLGKGDEAEPLLLAALKENPAQVGAWKDLGDLYYSRYEMEYAWRCWDVARKFAPTHPMLEGIRTLEQGLVEKYPEFL